MIRLNEMFIAPLVACTLAFLGRGNLMMVLSAATTAHKAWMQWLEYQDLRFQVQSMYLLTMAAGGPFIRTNDPTYQAYVYADGVMRIRNGMLTQNTRRPDPVRDPRPER